MNEKEPQDLFAQALSKLEELDNQIGALEAERADLRSFVNRICKFSGRDPMFPDEAGGAPSAAAFGRGSNVDIAMRSQTNVLRIRSDEFFGKPLAGAVRHYLELRKSAGLEPAMPDEIHTALVQGGFEFPSKDEREQMRGLQVSISKNSQTFRKLPNGRYGLNEWYKAKKKSV